LSDSSRHRSRHRRQGAARAGLSKLAPELVPALLLAFLAVWLVPSAGTGAPQGVGWRVESVWYKPRNPRTGAAMLECGRSGQIEVGAVISGPAFAEQEDFYTRPVRIGADLLVNGSRVAFERKWVEQGISAVSGIEEMGGGRWLVSTLVTFGVRCSSACEFEVDGSVHAGQVSLAVRAGPEKLELQAPVEPDAEATLQPTGEFEGPPARSTEGDLSCIDARSLVP